ncbi:hypothetical protein E2C01_017017 [Portunus trituberculatus]|uniref:Uncharacterized protein n=1 Tax=Portunus trituberculatus TaxID=210409 RepID=A0A5B7DSB6_PORTR|nr:hypothetical protein [Portunus trituberculatus]
MVRYEIYFIFLRAGGGTESLVKNTARNFSFLQLLRNLMKRRSRRCERFRSRITRTGARDAACPAALFFPAMSDRRRRSLTLRHKTLLHFCFNFRVPFWLFF